MIMAAVRGWLSSVARRKPKDIHSILHVGDMDALQAVPDRSKVVLRSPLVYSSLQPVAASDDNMLLFLQDFCAQTDRTLASARNIQMLFSRRAPKLHVHVLKSVMEVCAQKHLTVSLNVDNVLQFGKSNPHPSALIIDVTVLRDLGRILATGYLFNDGILVQMDDRDVTAPAYSDDHIREEALSLVHYLLEAHGYPKVVYVFADQGLHSEDFPNNGEFLPLTFHGLTSSEDVHSTFKVWAPVLPGILALVGYAGVNGSAIWEFERVKQSYLHEVEQSRSLGAFSSARLVQLEDHRYLAERRQQMPEMLRMLSAFANPDFVLIELSFVAHSNQDLHGAKQDARTPYMIRLRLPMDKVQHDDAVRTIYDYLQEIARREGLEINVGTSGYRQLSDGWEFDVRAGWVS